METPRKADLWLFGIEKLRMDRIGHKLSSELMQTNPFWPTLHVSARLLADGGVRHGRFLMIKEADKDEGQPGQINVVLNWFEELKRLVPTN